MAQKTVDFSRNLRPASPFNEKIRVLPDFSLALYLMKLQEKRLTPLSDRNIDHTLFHGKLPF